MKNWNFTKIVSKPIAAVSMLALIILGSEFAIMAFMQAIFKDSFSHEAFDTLWHYMDPLILTVITTPALYFLILRPMTAQQIKLQRQFDELGIAAATFESQEAILVTDAKQNILKVNHSFTTVTGYTSNEVVGKTPAILSSGRQDKEFYSRMWSTLEDKKIWRGEIWNRRKNGEIYPEWLNISAVLGEDGRVFRYVGIFSDISVRKASEASIQNLSFYDTLTALPNRRLLLDRLKKTLEDTARNHHHGALILLDLDHFKMLNDISGHESGDLLLIEAARRISACIREQDTTSRFGGDEFVVILKNLSTNTEKAALQAEGVAEKIRAALAEVYCLRHDSSEDNKPEVKYSCTASIGITLYCGHGQSIEELLKRTDIAMYEAKSSGRNAIRFFDASMQTAIETRETFNADLKVALDMHQFRLHYQIQVDSAYRPTGAEVLLRWEHPQNGLISPAQFIPMAEESGLILPIGQWVMGAACAQLKIWQDDPKMGDLQLAVNVSAKQFHQINFVDKVIATVKLHDITPALLNLELTESVVLENVDTVILKMKLLKEFGVRLSLDDFGTGYSSLSYLKRMPLDQIKIDQSFVRDSTKDSGDVVMIRSIVDLGMNFKLEVIAEGVETEAQLKLLQHCGCNNFQGYLFGKPVPIEQFEASVKKG